MATMPCLSQLCSLAQSPKEWEITPLVALSVAFGPRACEAITVRPDNLDIKFMGAKGQKGPQCEQMGPWACLWANFLAHLGAIGSVPRIPPPPPHKVRNGC